MLKNNNKTYSYLRKKYRNFVYENFSVDQLENAIVIKFHFNLDDSIHFRPYLRIPLGGISTYRLERNILENLAFHVGMIELISYWKAACPKTVIIKPFRLSPEQVYFWKEIYFKGLGEFFFKNQIKADFESFMALISKSDRRTELFNIQTEPSRVVVPVGGGKDSVVTLELLRNHFHVTPFHVNPTRAALHTTEVGGYRREDQIITDRIIDPTLIRMNNEGFLNGHTPFSALLAFVSLIPALLLHARHIALSNESSANEPTVPSGENHQYSKTFEFEMAFRSYISQFVSPDLNYFSFLRPLNELTIAKLFAKMKPYHSVFKSCNKGSKTNSWCGSCPKCLFVYTMLSPFLTDLELKSIFGKDLFIDAQLIQVLRELTGIESQKPFECVGTVDEVNVALRTIIANKSGKLPVLLAYYKSEQKNDLPFMNLEEMTTQLDNRHFLSPPFVEILSEAIYA